MPYSNHLFEPLIKFFRLHKQIYRAVILVLLGIGLLICWGIGSGEIKSSNLKYSYVDLPISDEDFNKNFSMLQVTDMDQVTAPTDAKRLFFDDESGAVEISEGGEYILSGSLEGSVHIWVKEQNVHLYLDGVEISSKSGPAIYCEEADKLVITLVDGTENTLTDSSNYRDDSEAEGCITTTCDLTINGTGTLTLNGYYKDAVHSRDIVKVLSGDLKIKCKRSAIHGNDGILIRGGSYQIASEKYGMKTTKSGADGRGALVVAGGEMNLIAGRYGFVTTKANLYIYNCSIASRSVVDTYQVGGLSNVQWGCVDER